MKCNLIFLLVLAVTGEVFGQQECGTSSLDSATFYAQPWIGNNQYLFDLVDSVEITNEMPENSSSAYEVVLIIR